MLRCDELMKRFLMFVAWYWELGVGFCVEHSWCSEEILSRAERMLNNPCASLMISRNFQN